MSDAKNRLLHYMANALLTGLEAFAATTPTQIDDRLVIALREWLEEKTGGEEPGPTPEDGGGGGPG